MEEQLSDVLDNVLGLLLLEGSYEIEESDELVNVLIETKDAGRLIGFRGESLESLQLIVNQIMSRKLKGTEPDGKEEYKRVILDVEGWRKQKEEDLKTRASEWAKQVLETGKEMELEPMSPWQRRIVHMAVEKIGSLTTESVGEGRDRHIVIKLKSQISRPEDDQPLAENLKSEETKSEDVKPEQVEVKSDDVNPKEA